MHTHTSAAPLPPNPPEPLAALVEILTGAQIMCRENLPAHAAAYLRKLARAADAVADGFGESVVAQTNRDLTESGVLTPAPRVHLSVVASEPRDGVLIHIGEVS